MEKHEFQSMAIALLRSAIGWQSEIARRLGVNARTVRRWIAAGEIPDWAEKQLRELIGGTSATPYPRDEWILGDGISERPNLREYLIHTAPPRFIARVVGVDDNMRPLRTEEPYDINSGVVVYTDIGGFLCEVEWIDQPDTGQITALMEAAQDALDYMTERDCA